MLWVFSSEFGNKIFQNEFSVDFVLVKNLAVCDFGFLNFGFCNFSADNVLGKNMAVCDFGSKYSYHDVTQTKSS